MRLRDIREDHDLTQAEVGKILNVTQTAYSAYELGKRQIPIEALIKLAKFYHTSVYFSTLILSEYFSLKFAICFIISDL